MEFYICQDNDVLEFLSLLGYNSLHIPDSVDIDKANVENNMVNGELMQFESIEEHENFKVFEIGTFEWDSLRGVFEANENKWDN